MPMDQTITAVLLLIEEQATEAEGEDARSLADVEVITEIPTGTVRMMTTTRELRLLVACRR